MSKIEYYLLASRVINKGTNKHMEMSKIEMNFQKDKYLWIKNHNKLGLNCWGNYAGLGLVRINKNLDTNFSLDGKIIQARENYSLWTFEEKINHVNSVDNELYGILEQIYFTKNINLSK